MDLNELVQRIGYFRNKINLSARELEPPARKTEKGRKRLEKNRVKDLTEILSAGIINR